jgi:hypothetical protein
MIVGRTLNKLDCRRWRDVPNTSLLVKIKLSVTSGGTPFLSTNTTDRHDITEILCKMALNINKGAKLVRFF